MENKFTNSKPLAVVTGASSGIGFQLARQFAIHGYDLLITADEDLSKTTVVLKDIGNDVEAVTLDLRTYGAVEGLYRKIKATGRPLDAIAINAGVGVGGRFVETELQEELDLISLNVLSTVHLTKRVARDMVDQGFGKILITSSVVARMPAPFEAVYAGSKAFGLLFAESIRDELKEHGVTVTALMPGPTNTNFFHRAGLDDTKMGREGKFQNEPDEVAKQGFDALMKGKDHVIAGTYKTKLQGLLARWVPEPLLAAKLHKESEPGSAERPKPRIAYAQ